MFSIRKFYNTDNQIELAGGSETEVAEKPAFNAAELMAKQGVKNTGMEPIAQPIDIKTPEKKEETKATEKPTPEVPSTEAAKVEKVETESPAKEEPAKTEAQPIAEKVEAKVQTWQEVLKSQPNTEVLKELGFDEKTQGIVSFLKENPKMGELIEAYKEGKHVDYLRELSTDYNKMSAKEVMRHQLKQEYPTANDKALEVLFRKEITEKYNLDSDDEAEREEGELMLGVKADKFRADFIANQEKYLMPTAKEVAKVEAQSDNTAAAAQQAKMEEISKQIDEHPYTKTVLANKSWSYGEGEDKFTFPIDPAEIIDIMKNGDKTGDLTFEIERNPDGSIKTAVPRTEKEILVATVKKHGVEFIKALANHYTSLGGKKTIEPIDNAKPPKEGSKTAADQKPKTIAEAMARHGSVNSGG